jgi:hypothetical protein
MTESTVLPTTSQTWLPGSGRLPSGVLSNTIPDSSGPDEGVGAGVAGGGVGAAGKANTRS